MEKRTTAEPLTATQIEVSADTLIIVLCDGRELRLPWQLCSQKLAAASQDERVLAKLSPGGYGIHWPLIDEDLSVGGLMRISQRESANSN